MNIDYYREFLVLARCLNYTKAAEKLHITQPALSKHIVSLENEFDAELFIRDRHAVQLTEAGRILYGCSMEVIDAYDRAKTTISAITRKQPVYVDGVLLDNTISSIISLTTILMNDRESAPVIFEQHEGRPLFEQLENDEVDIVLAYDEDRKLEEKDLRYVSLVHAPFIAIVDRNHPLAQRETISIDDLRGEVLIQFVDEYSLSGWRRIEQVCHEHGFEPRKRPHLGNATTSYTTTSPDGGVLILQKNLKQIKFLEDVNQTVILPFSDPEAYFVIYAIYKAENEEHLRPVLNVLEESRDIILDHHKRSGQPMIGDATMPDSD